MTHTLLQSVCICHISTHILTKRMTRQWRKQPTLPVYFNSHPHEEDDYFIFICPAPPFLFQLTSSRRGWLWCVEITLGCRHFNSHPHEEDDYTQALAELEKLISTHILTKRMTKEVHTQKKSGQFQLTSSRRGWLEDEEMALAVRRFQLTSSRRGWPSFRADLSIRFVIFQLTSSRRGWRNRSSVFPFFRVFQLTSSRRGWR